MADATDHQRKVRKALEGNERVFFHPTDELIAVWYGGAKVHIFDSKTWEQVTHLTVTAGFRDVDTAVVESAVENRMAREGYDRTGRWQDNTTVAEV